ncbi:MAG: murein L,D-transpeptidase catalytic domain family protein [Bacteroidales bacterium]
MHNKLLILFLATFFFSVLHSKSFASDKSSLLNSQSLYLDLGIKDLNFQAFNNAINGYNQIQSHKKEILTLIDFSKPSTEERLYVFDLRHKKLLFKSHVAHGRNSGANFANSFSNKNGSNKSSLGFYLTAETYQGKNGYSLKLDGLEKNINDNARQRAIVIHGAAYANPDITKTGRLGRSLGCPALPQKLNKPIIDTIKDGSVLFIYAPDDNYTKSSSFLQPIPEWFDVYPPAIQANSSVDMSQQPRI